MVLKHYFSANGVGDFTKILNLCKKCASYWSRMINLPRAGKRELVIELLDENCWVQFFPLYIGVLLMLIIVTLEKNLLQDTLISLNRQWAIEAATGFLNRMFRSI